jgi:hypothetical protein
MDINNNAIIGHIAGLTDSSKKELYNILKTSNLTSIIEIVDVDIITNKIIDDKNMSAIFTKFETFSNKIKDTTLSIVEQKNVLKTTKELEKKMCQYWKVKMEYYINKLSDNSKKKILLVGYLSFFKNHKIYLNLNLVAKFFLKVDYNNHAKTIIQYNLDNSRNDIINGNFDLNYLDINFLTKKRMVLQSIYSKINYITMNLLPIITVLELYLKIPCPQTLYYTSFVKYDKKIPIINEHIIVYTQEWLSLTSILTTSNLTNKIDDDMNIKCFEKLHEGKNKSKLLEKGIKNNKQYIKLTKDQAKQLSKNGYIYEITTTENFLPFPSKNTIYKYFTVKPIKINRVIQIDNILAQFKELNIHVEII